MKINRAYSLLEIKAVKEDQRVIRGTATTPTPDRLNDIVEPLGVSFKNPLPLLWQHRSSEPVGTVKFSKPTKDGIDFEASLPIVEEAGRLKDRIDEAWQSVKLGLVRAVSIGFRAVEYAFMDDGGIRFSKSEVFELSLVTIPANAEATIQSIKSIDTALRAASGLTLKKPTAAPGQIIKPSRAALGPQRRKINELSLNAIFSTED
jgi:HK97 family phage prohead protease